VALNSSAARTDIGYLRRRVKTQPAAEAAPPTERTPEEHRPAPAGLSLAPSAPAAPAAPALATAAAVSPHSLPFPAPAIEDVSQLGDSEPVLRLNARESAVGSLIVSGADVAVWEDAGGVTGSATAAGDITGTPVSTAGNRPLVGFDDADAIVSLRHVQRLRRALFISRGADPLGVQIFDGSTVTVAPGTASRMFILCLLRVGNLVELRAEPVDRSSSDEAILSQFGFTLTPSVAPRESRSR
jgi:hypothetical protein